MSEVRQLRVVSDARATGVDRESNTIVGMVLAQEGPFKTKGRGEFDEKSLRGIVSLIGRKKNGVKSRLSHPDACNDGIDSYLGRVTKPRMDSVTIERDGKPLAVKAVRADLKLDPASFVSPKGNLGEYVMRLMEAEGEAAASTSLVLHTTEEFRLDNHGKPRRNDAGEVLPALWRPTAIMASDIVDTGEAVDAALSVDGQRELSEETVDRMWAFLDSRLGELSQPDVTSLLQRLQAEYLQHRFGVHTVKFKSLESEWVAAFKKRAAGYDA